MQGEGLERRFRLDRYPRHEGYKQNERQILDGLGTGWHNGCNGAERLRTACYAAPSGHCPDRRCPEERCPQHRRTALSGQTHIQPDRSQGYCLG
jgi:hypothetical protein